MECLEKIIGLSQTTCGCIAPEESDTEFNESASGVFLDELDGFNLNVVKGADDCTKGGLWMRMLNAVEKAKQDFVTNLLSCVNQRFKPRADVYSGVLGQSNFTMNLNPGKPYAGIQIMPLQLRSGVIYLKRIGIVINTAVAVTVKVYRSINKVGEEIGSYTTSSAVTANQLTWLSLDTPLELAMSSYSGRVEYYVLMYLDSSFLPKNNVKDCNCGGVQRPYLKWLDFKGSKGTDPTDFNTFQQTKELNGLVLDVDIRCKTSEIICSSERPLDFENDGISKDMAYAIRFRAAAKLYADLLSSDQINRFTMMDREAIDLKIKEWNGEYTRWIEWFCGNISVGTGDCLICREGKQAYKGSILT